MSFDLERRRNRRAARLVPKRRTARAARGKADHLPHQGSSTGT